MGLLRVSDPIGEHLGPVPADKRAITVHHLLTHTAGLIGALGGDYRPLSRGELVQGALESKLRSRPGTEYFYSNLGYGVLAAIIERASGVGYEEFLARHLFEPAGMTETGYVLPEWRPGQVAVEYDARGESRGMPFDRPWADDGPYWNLRGNGGLLTTARDMFRWHLALMGDEVLDRGAIESLFTPYVADAEGRGAGYGYGWVVEDGDRGRVAWHDGGNAWNLNMLTILIDEDVMVFWVTNGYRDRDGGWNLARLEPRLTEAIIDRVATAGR
jgi:CubicO group peptidase (beta-lactamase class C family)